MTPQTNQTLSALRAKLEADLEGKNLTGAQLSEAEVAFIDEGLNLVKAVGYELEGFDDGIGPDEVHDVLKAMAEEEGDAELAEKVEALFTKYAS